MGLMKELNDLNNIYQKMYEGNATPESGTGKYYKEGKPTDMQKAKRDKMDKVKALTNAGKHKEASALYKSEEVEFEPSDIVKKLVESGKFSIDEVWKIVEVEEGYQRNPEKGEEEERKAEKRRKESGAMPPRGDKRREDFERWYAANVR